MARPPNLLRSTIAFAILLCGLACRPTDVRHQPEILVFAAASLTDVLPAIGAEWQPVSGATLRFAFDASSRIAQQIEHGAPADAVFLADAEWADWLDERALVVAGTRVNLWTNRLVVAARRGSGSKLDSLAGLLDPALQPIALAGESVPAGRYAKAALEKSGVLESVTPHVQYSDNVRGALAWVARGDVKTGIVYASDVMADSNVEKIWEIPAVLHPEILFPAGVVVSSSRKDDSGAFIQFCSSPRAKEIAVKFGFVPR